MPDKYQYDQYINVRKAFLSPEYRGLETSDPELKYDDFSKNMLAYKYILLKCKYPATFRRPEYRGKNLFVVLARADSEFHNRSKELIYLLDKLSTIPEAKSNESIDLILITKELLKKRTIKKMKEYSQFRYTNVLSVRFSIELPKANLCSRHEIVPVEEVKKLAEECYIQIDRLSYLSEDDAQNIWIGGLPGEVVKITRQSLMSGIAISYRYITGIIARPVESGDGDEDEGDEVDEKADE